MPPTKRAEAERKVPDLPAVLATWKAEGASLAEQAFRLRTLYGVTVTGETVRAWHHADNEPMDAA